MALQTALFVLFTAEYYSIDECAPSPIATPLLLDTLAASMSLPL